MAYQVTITKEDGKLIIVRKPVPLVSTRQEKLLKWCWIIVMPYMLCGTILTFLLGIVPEEERIMFLFVIVFFIVCSAIAVRDWLRKQPPPDYYHEILTFDTDRFVVKYCERVTAFAYRFDAKPEIRHEERPGYVDLSLSILIPCIPPDGFDPDELNEGCFDLWGLADTDAERVLAAILEHKPEWNAEQ